MWGSFVDRWTCGSTVRRGVTLSWHIDTARGERVHSEGVLGVKVWLWVEGVDGWCIRRLIISKYEKKKYRLDKDCNGRTLIY